MRVSRSAGSTVGGKILRASSKSSGSRARYSSPMCVKHNCRTLASAAMVAALFISTYALVGGRSPKLLGGGTVRRWVGLVLMAVSGGAMVCLVMMLYAALSRD